MGQGYSFEVLRAKVLFTEGVHNSKRARPKFGQRNDSRFSSRNDVLKNQLPAMSRMMNLDLANQHKSEGEIVNYGASISTLVYLIKTGER